MKTRDPGRIRNLLAANLRELRLRQSWSQYDLAAAGRPRQALISALELATANPTLESLDRIAFALGVELAELLLPATNATVQANKRKRLAKRRPAKRS
jgi:transcriptional regulator with XRE-family HTH domain